MSATYEKIFYLLRSSTAVKLLKADNAPFIISFFIEVFNGKEKVEVISESDFLDKLSDYLSQLNSEDQKYPLSAKEYLNAWTSDGSGFLRRYPENDELVLELTPSSENVLKWIEELEKPEFVGTESRLRYLIDILKNIAVKSNTDPVLRITALEKEKQKIEAELDKARMGEFEQFDDRQIREQFYLAQETARKLLGDFRQVEQNLRDIDKEFRRKIITSTNSKGKVLEGFFQQQDYLWQTNQGKSFKAFWEFLLLQNQQEGFDKIIQEIKSIEIIKEIESDNFKVDGIKNNLISAGSKANKTTGLLLEQLRRYLEHRSFEENKKIYENINDILKLRTEYPDNNWEEIMCLKIDEPIKISLVDKPLPLYTPKTTIKFKKTELKEGKPDSPSNNLYDQMLVDIKDLQNNIKIALKSRDSISLKDLISAFEVKKGVAEIIGYVEIASKSSRHICDYTETEELLIQNIKTSRTFIVTMPKIIYK